MKTCTTCNATKEDSEFSKRKLKVGYGLRSRCKECRKKNRNLKSQRDYYEKNKDDLNKKSKIHRSKNKKKLSDQSKVRYEKNKHSQTYKSNKIKTSKKYDENNPEKRKAHALVRTALRNGTLKKKNCEVCNSKDSESHHDDYSKPLEVRWLCRKHHIEHHNKQRMSKETS